MNYASVHALGIVVGMHHVSYHVPAAIYDDEIT